MGFSYGFIFGNLHDKVPILECVSKFGKMHFRHLELHFCVGFPRFLRTAAIPRSGSGGSAGRILWILARAGRACLRQWRDCYSATKPAGNRLEMKDNLLETAHPSF